MVFSLGEYNGAELPKKKKAYGLLTLFVDECPSTILKPRDGLLYEAKKLRPKVT